MQNKANLPDDQMNVSEVLTKDYERKTLGESGKNKANSNPNKANCRKDKMNVTFFYTKEYEEISNWAIYENKANFNPKQTQTKPISKAKKCCSPPYLRFYLIFSILTLNIWLFLEIRKWLYV